MYDFLLQNTNDILNTDCVQTTVGPTDIHCMENNTKTFVKVLNRFSINSKEEFTFFFLKNVYLLVSKI